MKNNMPYENLSKQAQPKKIIEALKNVKNIKEGKKEEKKGKINLSELAQKLAKKQFEAKKEEEENDDDKK